MEFLRARLRDVRKTAELQLLDAFGILLECGTSQLYCFRLVGCVDVKFPRAGFLLASRRNMYSIFPSPFFDCSTYGDIRHVEHLIHSRTRSWLQQRGCKITMSRTPGYPRLTGSTDLTKQSRSRPPIKLLPTIFAPPPSNPPPPPPLVTVSSWAF